MPLRQFFEDQELCSEEKKYPVFRDSSILKMPETFYPHENEQELIEENKERIEEEFLKVNEGLKLTETQPPGNYQNKQKKPVKKEVKGQKGKKEEHKEESVLQAV